MNMLRRVRKRRRGREESSFQKKRVRIKVRKFNDYVSTEKEKKRRVETQKRKEGEKNTLTN